VNIPRSIGVIQPMILFFTVSCSRAFIRLFLGEHEQGQSKSAKTHILIYGTGYSGRVLVRSLIARSDYVVLGFIEECLDMQGREVEGIRVYTPSEIPHLFETHVITDVILTTDSSSLEGRKKIIDILSSFSVRVRSIPWANYENNLGIGLSQLEDLNIDDLLPRKVVTPDEALLRRSIQNQIILITGAGGSIGSEIAKQVALLSPKLILLVDNSEPALYQINEALKRSTVLFRKDHVIPLLASVCDLNRMQEIFSTWRPDTVFHAAAYKHVPLVEHNPLEAIKNNVFGTHLCSELATTYDVRNFVLISTDKAVRPTNIMGATKRVSELILQANADRELMSNKKTIFSMVRFGNVLGSSGSVVPLFKHQISMGGPITITHRDVTRYFMSIPEAAQLVIQASSLATGGEVFVLNMGDPIRIIDLAKKMISLSGFRVRDALHPNGDIEILEIGLRPGEKLYEELLIGIDQEKTCHPKIMKSNEPFHKYEYIEGLMSNLRKCVENENVLESISLLTNAVSEYVPHFKVVDWCHLQKHH